MKCFIFETNTVTVIRGSRTCVFRFLNAVIDEKSCLSLTLVYSTQELYFKYNMWMKKPLNIKIMPITWSDSYTLFPTTVSLNQDL